MPETGKLTITVLLEHEIRAAAKAAKRFQDVYAEGSTASENERVRATSDLVNVACAALYGADSDDAMLILTSAKTLVEHKRKQSRTNQ